MSAALTLFALLGSSQAFAQATLTANFTRGAIAEYTNGPNGTSRGVLFSTQNITRVSVSQVSANGMWAAIKVMTQL